MIFRIIGCIECIMKLKFYGLLTAFIIMEKI